jgi:hypothetical protein
MNKKTGEKKERKEGGGRNDRLPFRHFHHTLLFFDVSVLPGGAEHANDKKWVIAAVGRVGQSRHFGWLAHGVFRAVVVVIIGPFVKKKKPF